MTKARPTWLCVLTMWLLATGAPAVAQSVPRASDFPPTLIPLAGQQRTPAGEPRSGNVLLVISMYAQQTDATPLWVEHQVATLTESGRYTILVGSTIDGGLPAHLFPAGGEAQWLGVAVDGEPEQPRVQIISVPYAARAASADVVGGKQAADLVLTENLNAAVRAALKSPAGILATPEVVPKWDSGLNLVESSIFSVGTKAGIGTPPAYGLDVDGDMAFSGTMFPSTDGSGRTGALAHASGSFIVYNDRAYLTLSANGRDDHLVVGYRQGQVGIGTTAPADFLHIETLDNGRLKMTRAGVNNVLLGDIGGVNDGGLLLYDGSGTRTVTIRADGTSFINGGNVGIGTSSPGARLHVAGDGRFDGTVTTADFAATFQDIAEWVDAAAPLEAGTVVVIDATGRNRVKAASTAYDSRVAGAVSPLPGLMLGEPGPERVLVAQSGRVRIKVDAGFGAIRPGDLLVTSPRPGHAMRAQAVRVGGALIHRPGTVLGKALEPLASGTGEILVLLGLK